MAFALQELSLLNIAKRGNDNAYSASSEGNYSMIVNAMAYEYDAGKIGFMCRPAFRSVASAATSPNIDLSLATNGEIITRAFLAWETRLGNKWFIAVIGSDLWYDNGGSGSWTRVADQFTDDSAGGPVGYTFGVKSDGTEYIFICGANEAYTYTDVAGTFTITAVTTNLPTPLVPSPAFLDGYIFVAKEGTNDIYNTPAGDPSSFTASAFIRAETSGDLIVGLTRQREFIVAIKERSIEFFRDAGIPAPNSPLLRVTEKTLKYGSQGRNGHTSIGDDIYFVGHPAGGTTSIYHLSPDGRIESISNEWLDRLYGQDMGGTVSSSVVYRGQIKSTQWGWTNASSYDRPDWISAFSFTLHGRPFLGFTASRSYSESIDFYGTLIYDVKYKLWTIWAPLVEPDASLNAYFVPHAVVEIDGLLYTMSKLGYYNSGTGQVRGNAFLLRVFNTQPVDTYFVAGSNSQEVNAIQMKFNIGGIDFGTGEFKFMKGAHLNVQPMTNMSSQSLLDQYTLSIKVNDDYNATVGGATTITPVNAVTVPLLNANYPYFHIGGRFSHRWMQFLLTPGYTGGTTYITGNLLVKDLRVTAEMRSGVS